MSAPVSRLLVKTSTPGIYKRGNRYVVIYRDAQGKQRKQAARTLAAARKVKRQRDEERDQGVRVSTASRRPFEDYARDWVAAYTGRTARGIRPETRAEYERDLELYAIPYFGRRRLGSISAADIEDFVRWLANEAPPSQGGRRKTPGLATGSVRNAYAPVRAMFAQAAVRGDVQATPCRGVIVPVTDAAEPAKVKALGAAQERALVAAMPERWQVLARFMLSTGLRISEVVALDIGSIDWDAGLVRVEDRIRNGQRGAPKSRHGVRKVPLGQALMADLRHHRDTLSAAGPNDPLWQSRPGVRMNPGNSARRVLKPAARRVGLDWVAWHTLRHTAATRWLTRGQDPLTVSRLLGHSSPAFTLTRYAHFLEEHLPDGDLLAAA